METVALIIGYTILTIVAGSILLFAFALGWLAIHEARGIISSRKWRKRKLYQLKCETARDCAIYLCRWGLPPHMTVYQAREHFERELDYIQKHKKI